MKLSFKGGIHPPENKEISNNISIKEVTPPKQVVIPLIQHIGAETKCVVEIGQIVKKGELIGEPTAFVSSAVHSSVSGKVMAIVKVLTPIGRIAPAVVIENDGKDDWIELEDNPNYIDFSPEELKDKIKKAGIVGMGGAAFPTHVKLSPPKDKPIDVVILNGAECEPYLTADHRLMVEFSMEIVEGLKIIMKILGVNKGYIGIENNKLDAIEKMKDIASDGIEVISLDVKYPQGAEKMLIKAITEREVPAGGLPMDVGVVVQNVGTAYAIYEACRWGKPLIQRVVTISGRGIEKPANLKVAIGTFIKDLINECGGFTTDDVKVILGGPMMGFAQWNLDVPIVKGTSGILVLSEKEYASIDEFGACIRCGRCIDVCPMGLMPSMLSILAEKGYYEDTKDYNIFDCFECGSCTYVCPAKRPIVQLIRLAKNLLKKC